MGVAGSIWDLRPGSVWGVVLAGVLRREKRVQ